MDFHREITPLTEGDCLLVFERKKTVFDFPLHFHPEYELNFILGGTGAKRVVGDHISEIGDAELVLTGPNLLHCWEQGRCTTTEMLEITIQFHSDLFHNSLLNRNVMRPIRTLLENSLHGIAFSKESILQVTPRVRKLPKLNGIDALLELLQLLFDLSNSRNQMLLSRMSVEKDDFANSERIKKVYEFVQANFGNKILIKEVAQLINMTEVSFSRFFKTRTGRTFIEFLNDYRIGHATRKLLDGSTGISEIAFVCGFNNISNFNRIFKKKNGITPTEFRANFGGLKRVN